MIQITILAAAPAGTRPTGCAACRCEPATAFPKTIEDWDIERVASAPAAPSAAIPPAYCIGESYANDGLVARHQPSRR
jgi:hypothetical protein